MRILDEDHDLSISRLTLLLTSNEARELSDSLNDLSKHDTAHHAHISSDDYHKELTIAIYDPEHIDKYNHRCHKLIIEDV